MENLDLWGFEGPGMGLLLGAPPLLFFLTCEIIQVLLMPVSTPRGKGARKGFGAPLFRAGAPLGEPGEPGLGGGLHKSGTHIRLIKLLPN